jgi:hypothetical protein
LKKGFGLIFDKEGTIFVSLQKSVAAKVSHESRFRLQVAGLVASNLAVFVKHLIFKL